MCHPVPAEPGYQKNACAPVDTGVFLCPEQLHGLSLSVGLPAVLAGQAPSEGHVWLRHSSQAGQVAAKAAGARGRL